MIDAAIAELIQKAKRKRQQDKTAQNRLGMMRHVFLIVDCTENMNTADLKPSRLFCTIKLLENFIQEFFDQNPISQMGIIALKGKRAEKLTELTGTAKRHIQVIQDLAKLNPSGEPSLQNGLDMALKALKVLPSHASREILVIMGSLTTCDPVDINVTVESLKTEGIRTSIISLSAEVRICRYITAETGGNLGAALDDSHFKDQLMAHIDPPHAAQTQENALIKMGFPHPRAEESKGPILSMCMCHIDNKDDPSKLSSAGFHCPQCSSKYCELPVECLSCGLTLVSAPHLARSYHHLFPVKQFREVLFNGQSDKCYACQKLFSPESDKHVYFCEICEQFYCCDCDLFIHDTMHTCVGCNTIPGVQKRIALKVSSGQGGFGI